MSKIKLNKNTITNKIGEYLSNFKLHSITCSLRHLLTFIIIGLSIPAFAYEDCIISTNGKLTDIKIQHNDVIDVFPLITVMNEKNTLIVHPLKNGKTKFSVQKNEKEKVIFEVEISPEKTTINEVAGFDIFTIDCPPYDDGEMFELDEPPAGLNIDKPPVIKKVEK